MHGVVTRVIAICKRLVPAIGGICLGAPAAAGA
jgi:hypothetical protein